MSIFESIACCVGVLAIIVCFVWIPVIFSTKKDEKKRKEQADADQLRLSRIEKYLDSVAVPLGESDQALIFKLKNRWKLIYRHLPISHIPHPQLMSACAERDAIEVELMDKGIYLEYPD